MNEEKKKSIRIRTQPVRRWQRTEERSLIEFLKKNANDFERPTAQFFYKKFIDECNIVDIEWKLVRAKVRNMRICYGKAKQWMESQGANEGENVRDVLQKMCTFYDDFEEIFSGTSKGEFSFSFDGSISSDCIKEENLSDDCEASYTTEDILMDTEMVTFLNEDSNEVTMGQKDKSTQEFKRRRLDVKETLKVEELKLQRERLAFEKQKLKQELDIKQREIDSQERLKILELEMKERIAMNELKMKERVALKALDKKWD